MSAATLRRASTTPNRERSARNAAAAARARWLHDHVLSEVRLTIVRLEVAGVEDAALRELLDLEHRLRCRHLDELIVASGVSIGEVVQAHLRWLEHRRIEVVLDAAVPELELELTACTARRLHDALGVLVPNAAHASARRVEIGIAITPHDTQGIELVVGDDAGGFDLDSIPIGRGLWRLWRELGRDRLWQTVSATSWRVHALIDVEDLHGGER